MKNLFHGDIEKLDELPKRINNPLGGGKWGRYKGRNYPYNKVRRFLESRVGRNWDAVFSEYVHVDWIKDEDKTKEKIGWSVVMNTFWKDGEVWYCDHWNGQEKPIEDYRYGGECFYIHPKTKILCFHKRKKTDYAKQMKDERSKRLRILGDYHQLVKENGTWYEVKGVPIPSEVIEIDGLHYRPLQGFPTVEKNCKYINGQWYMACKKDDRKVIGPRDEMIEHYDRTDNRYYYFYQRPNYDSIKLTVHRQLNSKELKKHGLKNDVKVKGKPCPTCGNPDCQKHENVR